MNTVFQRIARRGNKAMEESNRIGKDRDVFKKIRDTKGTLYSFGYMFSLSPLPLAFLLFSAICKASSGNHFYLLAFLFLEYGLGHHLLYNVTNFHPYFFRHSVHQI